MDKFFVILFLLLSVILFSQADFALAKEPGDYCCADTECSSLSITQKDGGTVSVAGDCFCEPKDPNQCEIVLEDRDGDGVSEEWCKKGKLCGACYRENSTVFCPTSRYTSIAQLIQAITNWIFYIGLVLAPLMIVIAAFIFLTSAGSADRINLAKKMIIWTCVGLAVIVFGKGIYSLIRFILGV